MNDFLSKQKQVELYLLAGNSITQKEAIELFHAYRLSAIIYNLRRQHYKIATKRESHGKIWWTRYRIAVE